MSIIESILNFTKNDDVMQTLTSPPFNVEKADAYEFIFWWFYDEGRETHVPGTKRIPTPKNVMLEMKVY